MFEFVSFDFGLLSVFIDFVGLPQVEEEADSDIRFQKLPGHSKVFLSRVSRVCECSIGIGFLAGKDHYGMPRR
jgi:hypothetical protein